MRCTLPLIVLALAGCASATLRYTPDRQPAGIPISADYRVLTDRLRVEIDTGGYRLERVEMVRADGSTVRPETIEHPPFRGSGIGLGLGVGTGHWSSGGVGFGIGMGTGTMLGRGRAEGNTFAFFPLDRVGPAPWRLQVTLVGLEPVVIVLGPEEPA